MLGKVYWSLLVLVSLSFALQNVTGCMYLSTSDTYTLNQSLFGANLSALPLSGSACVSINASNVILDCQGFGVGNNGTAGTTYGIVIVNSQNVTIRNCSVSLYTDDVYLHDTNESVLGYISAVNTSSGFGFTFDSSSNNTAANDTAGNVSIGFMIQGNSFYNSFENNTAYGYINGFQVQQNLNSFIGNNVSGGAWGIVGLSIQNTDIAGNL